MDPRTATRSPVRSAPPRRTCCGSRPARSTPLHRLEAQGWVISVWQPSDKGKRAKYYTLTAIGRQQLVVEQSKWEQLSLAMTRILRLAE
ncbi:MAG TPA: helix-turn-helix transcriptional regulator [Vicinamibacterales bacterium]|nr:helix-turn-helix transcriptional regulator [Vicinamibacterales bacterium]